MTQPPEYLLPLLHSIEVVVVEISQEFPKLKDKEIESVYEKLTDYYKGLSTHKAIDEPFFESEQKQVLTDEILNRLDEREEAEADLFTINNPSVRQGEHMIPSLHHLYIIAFKRLQKSVKFWRKKEGPKGYLTYLSRFI